MSKLTANQREFEKQIRKLNRLISKVENEGLVFIERPIEPIKPKRITSKFLQKMSEEISLPSLRSKAYEIDKSTGELTPHVEPLERKARKRGASYEALTGTPRTPREEPQRTPRKKKPKAPKAPRTKRERPESEEKQGTMPSGNPRLKKHFNYSAEELHDIRSQASRKAWDTIRRKMREDPEYAKKMRDIWSKNLEKARAKRGTKEPPEPEEPIKSLPSPEEQKKQEIEDQENAPDYTPANATDETLNNMYAILNSATNKYVADVLIRVADDQAEIEGREELARRLSTGNDSYWVLDLATKVAFYDSHQYDEIKKSAYALAYILTNGDVGQFTQDEIDSALAMQFGGYYD